ACERDADFAEGNVCSDLCVAVQRDSRCVPAHATTNSFRSPHQDSRRTKRLAMRRFWVSLPLLLICCRLLSADGPRDNIVDNVRPVPPPGITISDADRDALQVGLDELGQALAQLQRTLKGKPALLELLPDVQIYHNAVRYALTFNEFFQPRELGVAKNL